MNHFCRLIDVAPVCKMSNVITLCMRVCVCVCVCVCVEQLVEQYLQQTHAATHNQYKMKLLEVYDVEKKGEKEKFEDCGNRCVDIL